MLMLRNIVMGLHIRDLQYVIFFIFLFCFQALGSTPEGFIPENSDNDLFWGSDSESRDGESVVSIEPPTVKIEDFDFGDEDETYLFVFNVGQGNFIVLRKGSRITIIDVSDTLCDKLRSDENFKKAILKIFEGANITNIIISHNHKDHLGGLSSLLDFLKSKKLKEEEKFPSIVLFLSEAVSAHQINKQSLESSINKFFKDKNAYYFFFSGNWRKHPLKENIIEDEEINNILTEAIFWRFVKGKFFCKFFNSCKRF